MKKKRNFPDTSLYCITASEYSLGRSNQEVVEQMLDAGVKLIQYREKELTMQIKYRECLVIQRLCKDHNAFFIVNDDVALAMAVEADGVHLGQDDLPAGKVRELVGEEMLIGLSVATVQQADDAIKSGVVDYLGVGPIFQTDTKKDASAPIGLEHLENIARRCQIPIVAIGGIKQENMNQVMEHGAACAAMISEIVGSHDIGQKIKAIQESITHASP